LAKTPHKLAIYADFEKLERLAVRLLVILRFSSGDRNITRPIWLAE
jgi:hypothetical protein